MSYDYWSTSSQAERKEVLQNDRDCFQSRAAAEADLEAQGRFKRHNETQVIGTGAPSYPAIPSGPWSEADRNVEPPLGYDISAVEPVIDERPNADPHSENQFSPDGSIASGPEPTSLLGHGEPEVGSSTPFTDAPVASLDVSSGDVSADGGRSWRLVAPPTPSLPSSSSPSDKFIRRF